MDDLISRQAAIDAVHKEFDEVCVWDESGQTTANEIENILYELPSTEPDNQVHLCGFCKYDYPECPSEWSDVIFGNGMGHDNICACSKFEIKQERTAKAEMLEEPFRTSMTWEGKCSNCGCYTIHEMNYCFGCGMKLIWSNL